MTAPATSSDERPATPPDASRVRRSVAGLLFDLAGLHGQLAHVEFALEQQRIEQRLATRLRALAFGFIALLLGSGVLIALAWDGPWRLFAALGLPAFFTVLAVLAWRRYRALARIPDPGFSASRRELAADFTLLGLPP